LVLAVAAALLWLASRFTWTWSRHPTPLRGNVVDVQTGAEANPVLVPFAVLALAAIAGVLATSGWIRRIEGGLIGLAGVGVFWAGTVGLSDVFGAHPADYPAWQVLGGRVLVWCAGALMLCASALVVWRSEELPRLGARYASSPDTKRRDPDVELWQALSDGEDPTAR
jgi:uncharacterized membrane protein (TIGR02234 family)